MGVTSTQTIGTVDGRLVITNGTVDEAATPVVLSTDNPREVLIINEGTSVMRLGGASVATGSGIPLAPGYGAYEIPIGYKSPGTTLTNWYLSYPGGGGAYTLVELE